MRDLVFGCVSPVRFWSSSERAREGSDYPSVGSQIPGGAGAGSVCIAALVGDLGVGVCASAVPFLVTRTPLALPEPAKGNIKPFKGI